MKFLDGNKHFMLSEKNNVVSVVLTALIILQIIPCVLPVGPTRDIDAKKSLIYGPGLKSDIWVPVRHFFLQAVDSFGENITESLGKNPFTLKISANGDQRIRISSQILDRNDGSYIFRYKPFVSYRDLQITIKYQDEHVAKSPYTLKGHVYHEKCDCPVPSTESWYNIMQCPDGYSQIDEDLYPFKRKSIDLEKVAKKIVHRFSNKGMHSLCHYKIIDNKVYRKTYGEHVGFKMFSDEILLSITRKVVLPDIEFFVNLGDWPLVIKRKPDDKILPIFSWCGSDDSKDIIMPTYDITDTTLKMMDRVTLDQVSAQCNTGPRWENKTSKAFWRGRDSRQERLDLVVMSRKNPELIDAALTHMFFFPKDPEKYGEIQKSISFFDFFKYKYQINVDGTVAAYRLPYLLAGDSVVLKQNSPYYEFFYKQLVPYEHYIPFKRDLSDLKEKLNWAKEHDDKCKNIAINGRNFVRDNLMPENIYCYHVKLFEAFSHLQQHPPKYDESFELVKEEDGKSRCKCERGQKAEEKKREEL